MKNLLPRLAVSFPSLLLALSAGCREPTEIVLDVRTNVDCSDKEKWGGIAIYVGQRGVDERSEAPVTGALHCDGNGHIGSLVITPSGAKDELISIRVVAAASAEAKAHLEDCAANDYKGCIVARRAVRFGPHARLDINVELTQDCLDEGCDPEHSCRAGSCVEVPIETQDNATPAPAPTTPTPSEHTVRCGDNNQTCSTSGAVCCLTVDMANDRTTGRCIDPKDCPSGDIVLNCDDDTDCEAQDTPEGEGLCLLSWTPAAIHAFTPATVSGSQCVTPDHRLDNVGLGAEPMMTGLILCETRQPCQNGGGVCLESHGTDPELHDNPLPGYHWCNLSPN